MPKHEGGGSSPNGPLNITNSSADNTISIDQNGNVGTDVKTDGALHIENTDNSGLALGVYTNIGADMDSDLVKFWVDNSSADKKVLTIVQDGADAAVEIQKLGTPGNAYDPALYINVQHTSSNSGAIRIQDSSPASSLLIAKSGDGAHIQFTGDPANASSSDGELWFDGTNLKINIAGTVYNLDRTVA